MGWHAQGLNGFAILASLLSIVVGILSGLSRGEDEERAEREGVRAATHTRGFEARCKVTRYA
jgi:hypothetical protein